MTISSTQQYHDTYSVTSGNMTNGACSDSHLQAQIRKVTICDFENARVTSSSTNTRKGYECGMCGLKGANIPINQKSEQSGTTFHQKCTTHHHCQRKGIVLLNSQRSIEKCIDSPVIYYNATDSKSRRKISEVKYTKYIVMVYDKSNAKSYATHDKNHTKWKAGLCAGSRKVQVQQCSQNGRHPKHDGSEFHNGRDFSRSERLRICDNLICSHIHLFVASQNRTEFEHDFHRGYENHRCVDKWENMTNVTKERENMDSNKPTFSRDVEHQLIPKMTSSYTNAADKLPSRKDSSYHLDLGIVSSGILPDIRRASVTKEYKPTPLEFDMKETLRSVRELDALCDLTGVHQTQADYGSTRTTHADGNTYLYHQSSPFPVKETETDESKFGSKDMFRHFDIDSYIQSLQIPTVAPFLSLQSYFVKIANREHVSNNDKMVHEGLRLSSFSDINVSVSCISLAAAGFYATGNGDETRCFSCGVRHTGWRDGDNIFSIHKLKSPTCIHALGTDQRNIPIHPPSTHEPAPLPGALSDSAGAAGIALVMHNAPNVITAADGIPPALQANSTNGACIKSAARNVLENYNLQLDISNKPTGESVKDDDMTAFPSASDDGVPSTSFQTNYESVSENGIDTAVLPVSRRGTVNRSFGIRESAVQSDSATGSPNNLEMNMLMFDNAIYPNYWNTSTRFASFLLWPNNHCKKPAELVPAGFFYAGFSDCVRCFVCGVGLKTWEKEDNPWVEHVRWRASCTYVRVIKGEAFITQALAVEGQRRREHGIPGIIDQAGNTTDGDILEWKACQRALEMGYSRNRVSKHALDILGKENHTLTLEVLLLDILAEEDLEMSSSSATKYYREPPTASGSDQAITPISRTALQGHNQLMIGEAVVGRFPTHCDDRPPPAPDKTVKTAAVGSKIPSISVQGAEQKHEKNEAVRKNDLETDAGKATIPRGHANERLTCSRQEHRRQAAENTVSDEDEGDGPSHELSEMLEGDMFHSLPVMPRGQREINKLKRSSAKRRSTKEQRKAAEEEIEKLKESNLCKICLEDPANIVFLPCGHLVACAMCAPALERCPVCRRHIRGSVRVHLSTHLKNKIR